MNNTTSYMAGWINKDCDINDKGDIVGMFEAGYYKTANSAISDAITQKNFLHTQYNGTDEDKLVIVMREGDFFRCRNENIPLEPIMWRSDIDVW